jgi:hypothetical protein
MKRVAAMMLVAATAAAAPFKETLSKAEVDTIVDAIEKALPPVDQAAVAKCQLFLDAYNKAPSAPDAIQHVVAAGSCFRAAGSLGAAIMSWTTAERYGTAADMHVAIRELGPVYEAAARFDRAATYYEMFASQFANEPDAYDRLQRALCIRRQLGDERAATTDAEKYQRWAKRNPATACDSLRPIAMPLAH